MIFDKVERLRIMIGFWRCSLIMINRYIRYIVILIVDFEYLRKGIEI